MFDSTRVKVQKRIKELRYLERLMENSGLKRLYVASNPTQRAELDDLFHELNLTDILSWIERVKRANNVYREMTVNQLRQLAKKRRIPRYQYLDKIDLVIELEDRDGKS